MQIFIESIVFSLRVATTPSQVSHIGIEIKIGQTGTVWLLKNGMDFIASLCELAVTKICCLSCKLIYSNVLQ